ncbi:MAG: hypothetical protein U0359_11000 [Byssovorax sp.]
MPTSHPPRTPSSQYIVAAGDRIAIVAGLAFLDGVGNGSFGATELRGWFETHLVRTKRMAWSGDLHESGFGTMALPAGTGSSASFSESFKLHGLISMARKRVVLALRGLIAVPMDDRFLNAAIFNNRVKRETVGQSSSWSPQPKPTDNLSDIVLCLFAADILSHRETYERGLCVCETCGRVWFDPTTRERRTCPHGVTHYNVSASGSMPPPSMGPPSSGSPASGGPSSSDRLSAVPSSGDRSSAVPSSGSPSSPRGK